MIAALQTARRSPASLFRSLARRLSSAPPPAAESPKGKGKVLFVGHGLTLPSHRWMRSMLTGLEEKLAAVAAPGPAPSWLPRGVRYARLDPRGAAAEKLPEHELGTEADPARALLREAIARPDVGPTVFHFLNRALPYADLWAEAGKPLHVHVHGYDVTWDMKKHESGFSPTHGEDYIARVQALPDDVRFIANSEETLRRLTGIGIAPARVAVKPLGVKVGPRPEPRVSPGPVQFLYIGRLVDCKGPDLTVEAFTEAVRNGLDGELTVAGSGPLEAACRLIAHRRGVADRVKFPGLIDTTTAKELWAAADVFTAHSNTGPLSNQTEAFGVVFAEALAAGLPVVTGRSGGVPEVVPDGSHGEAPGGILFEPGDVAAHAAALLKLGSDPALRHAMAVAGWEHAKSAFRRKDEDKLLRRILGYGRKKTSRSADRGAPTAGALRQAA